MGKGGTWLTSRGYPPLDGMQLTKNQSSSSSSFGGGGKGDTENAVSNKPLQSDPRFIFDTKTIRFYAFETSNETAVAKPPGAPIGILDPLQDRTCDQITGRRKKEETLKMNHMERLVGMDAPARPGDRVIISSRAKDVRKQGWPVVGTIIENLDKGLNCAVQWDDGRGPYKYSISKVSGFQLAFIQPDHEAHYTSAWRHRPAVYWSMNRVHAPSGDAVAAICETLADRGCDVLPDLMACGAEHMAIDVPKARMAVVCLTRGYVADCNKRGACRAELEYIIQHMGPERVLLLVLDHGLRYTDLGLIASPLAKSLVVDYTTGDERALQQLAERFQAVKPIGDSAASSRVQTAASSTRY